MGVDILPEIISLNGDIWQIDLDDCGIPGRSAGYFIRGGNHWMLVETGPASSLPRILEAAKALGIDSSSVKYIAVTHIHLDHAGGVGVLARHFQDAGIVVHEKGARHIIDPTKLIAGATIAWGEKMMKMFGEVLPVAGNRVIPSTEGDLIRLGDRVIEIWDTPGHAKHHLCYYDRQTKGLFSGDAAGVYQPRLSQKLNRPAIRPATPVPDFDAPKMYNTLFRIAVSEIERIYFTHFGMAEAPQMIVEMLTGQLTVQLELAKKYFNRPDAQLSLQNAMVKQIKKGLLEQPGEFVADDKRIQDEWDFMTGIMHLSVAGILDYLKRKEM